MLANCAGRELMPALIRVKRMGFLVVYLGCGSIIKPRLGNDRERVEIERIGKRIDKIEPLLCCFGNG